MATDSFSTENTTDALAGAVVSPQAEYPGIATTCDGAEAVVWVEKHISQGSGAYPITSSTTMGGGFNQAVMNGETNLWGDPLLFFEPESEHSAATFCEGFAVAGGRRAGDSLRWPGHLPGNGCRSFSTLVPEH